jgi:hypothetical protein
MKKAKTTRNGRSGRARPSNTPPNLKSGIRTVIKSNGGVLPPVPWAAEVAEQADAIVAQMVADLGYDSPQDAPAAQRAILESQRLNLLVLGLANRYLRAQGITDRKGKPHAILAVCVSFSNSLRHNAVVLGLERRLKNAKTLDARLAEIADREDVDAAQSATNENHPQN